MKKNIFIILFFIFFATNLYANCSSLYRSLGSPSKVSLLWLDDKRGTPAQYALINKIKGNTFSLCSKVRSNYNLKDTNVDSLKDFDFYKDFYNAEDAFKEVFKITSEENTRYILSKLYLPDYGINKSALVTAFAFSQKEEQVSKYITKKKPKPIKKEKIKSKEYAFCKSRWNSSPFMKNQATCFSNETTFDADGYVKAKLQWWSENAKGDKKVIFQKIKAGIKKEFSDVGLNTSIVDRVISSDSQLARLDKNIDKTKTYITRKKPKEEPKKTIKKPTVVKQKEFKVAAKDLDETPPELTIKDKFVFEKPNYTIKGQVRDKGSKKLYVFVDNQMIDVKNGRFQIKRFSPDSEKLEVKAVDQWGNEIVKLIDIEIKVKKTELVKKLDPLNPSKIRNTNQGDVVALVIGIETYAEAPKAVYANRDAKFFAEYARYAFGAPRNNIKLLIDKEATLPKMYGALEKWLPAKIKSDQTDVIVFFAGHGLASNDGKNLYLLTQDSDTDLLSRTALSRTELFKLINQHNPKSVKMFFDTCYSGQSREEKTLLASARPIRIGVKESGGVPSNFTIFSASQLDQISSGLKEAKHGIFSYYLMKGLEGAADKNKDRQITNGELLAYMEKEVNSKAIELGRSQVPSFVGIKDNTLNSTKLKNFSHYILISLLSILLLSCSGYMAELEQKRLERERVKQQQQLANDKQICKAYGFEEGATSFSDCLMKLDFNRKKIAEMKKMRECEAVRRDNSQSGVTGFWGGVLMGARENLACD